MEVKPDVLCELVEDEVKMLVRQPGRVQAGRMGIRVRYLQSHTWRGRILAQELDCAVGIGWQARSLHRRLTSPRQHTPGEGASLRQSLTVQSEEHDTETAPHVPMVTCNQTLCA